MHAIQSLPQAVTRLTPVRTHSISGQRSRVLILIFLALKMMVKSGLDFISKFTEPLPRYLLTCQANSALMGRFLALGSSNSEGEFQNKKF